MRTEFKKINNVRGRFYGVFVRYGSKTNWNGFAEPTVLLKDIKACDGDKMMADHLWFKETLGFKKLGQLQEGDLVYFDARVKPYVKGYVNRREWIDNRQVDYRLSHPTKFNISRQTASEQQQINL